MNQIDFDKNCLKRCVEIAKKSPDPSTKVGALLIAGPNNKHILCYNSFPTGIAITENRLIDRELKLKLMVHAEMQTIVYCSSMGIPTKNSTLYIAAINLSGEIWGGPPCTRCTVELIASGIRRIVSFSRKKVPSFWQKDLDFSEELLIEANINYTEIQI